MAKLLYTQFVFVCVLIDASVLQCTCGYNLVLVPGSPSTFAYCPPCMLGEQYAKADGDHVHVVRFTPGLQKLEAPWE